ncbi:MAG: carboxypeptidase regulatory-like domain-containing protein, partial [Bacteroidia bacterium]|nr:carboxypeptidase regulatory-like domain-containing protein [Bacteroidia bacterium]
DGIKRNNNGLSILKGTIREGAEGYVMPDVEVIIKDASGKEVASTSTGEGGEYFVTLPGGHYTLIVKKKGYKDISESFDISASNKETISLEKGYLLKK